MQKQFLFCLLWYAKECSVCLHLRATERRENRKEIWEAGAEGGRRIRKHGGKGWWILGAREGCQKQLGG